MILHSDPGEARMTAPRSAQAGDIGRRTAAQFLNYPGDVVDGFNPLAPMGPNTIGEALWPVSSSYDPDTDTTRVGLSYIAPGQPTA